MKNVEIIKPSNKYLNLETKESIKKKVCAYDRVSTDDEDQLNSYKLRLMNILDAFKKMKIGYF